MKLSQLHRELSARLRALSNEAAAGRLLGELQDWLKSRLGEFDADVVERYGLDKLATIDLRQYPVARSSMNAGEEARQLVAVTPTSLETLAMRLRDAFWAGITVGSGVQCPNCGDSELRTLCDDAAGKLVFACDPCGWAQMPDGQPWQGSPPLVPPTNEVLNQGS